MNLEELRREYDEAARALRDAKARRDKARNAWVEAAIEVANAEFEARGITPGTVVIGTYFNKKQVRGVYVGHAQDDWGGDDIQPRVMKVKKDGTAHAMQMQWGSNWRLPE